MASSAIRRFGRFLKGAAEAAGRQQRALDDLSAALTRAGVEDASAATDEFAEFAAQLQQVTTVGDETAIQVAAMGASFGITGKELQTATRLSADMSRVLGTDLKASMLLLGKAASGNVSALTRYGISIEKGLGRSEAFSAVLKQMEELFGGAATETENFLDKSKQLDNVFGDLKETIAEGEFLLDVIDNLKETVTWWDRFIEGVKEANRIGGDFKDASRAQREDLQRLRTAIAEAEERIFFLSSSLDRSKGALKRMREEELIKLTAELDALTRELKFTEEAFRDSIETSKKTEKRLARLKEETKKLREEEEKRNAAAKEAIRLEKVRQEALKRAAVLAAPLKAQELADEKALEEQRAKALAAAQKLAQQRAAEEKLRQQAAQETARAIGELGASFVTAAASAASGEQTIEDALKDTIRALASAAAAAAARWALTAPIPGQPVTGLALAPIVAAAAFALVSQLANFQRGGVVTGPPGIDNVPAMLTAGEMVLPRDVSQQIQRVMRMPATPRPFVGMQAGGLVRSTPAMEGVGPGTTVTLQIQTMTFPSQIEVDRAVKKNITPALQRLRRKGFM